MPLYEYHCSKCEKNFEVLQKFSDAPLETHEECGGAVERVLSAPAFQLKGTGWYVTDYARSGSKDGKNGNSEKAAKSESGDSKSSESKSSDSKSSESKSSETKSEPKPAAKSE
jgi:putative FmdB family regulatory protein